MLEKQNQENDGNTSLDPRAIQTLLEGIDMATRRGAFSIQEAGTISNAYMHTVNALNNLSKGIEQQRVKAEADAQTKSQKSSTKSSQKNGENS